MFLHEEPKGVSSLVYSPLAFVLCGSMGLWLFKVMKTVSLFLGDLLCLFVTWKMFTSHQIGKL